MNVKYLPVEMIRIGSYELEGEGIGFKTVMAEPPKSRSAIYAFAVDKKVVYMQSARRDIYKALKNYCTSQSKFKVRGKIFKTLKSEMAVLIYIWLFESALSAKELNSKKRELLSDFKPLAWHSRKE